MFRVLAQEGGPLEVTFGSFENTWLWIVLAVSLVALAFAWFLRAKVLAEGEGSDTMKGIATSIQEGAKAYLSRQFRTLGIFLGLLTVVLFFALPVSDFVTTSLLGLSPELSIRFGRSIAFLLGAGASMLTGYAGMWLAVRANVRTANAAKESGLRKALTIAFRAGGVAGMFTVGLGLFGATLILIIFKGDATSVLVGFGFGGALLAMFMRVGGGIFTKAADVGADLVGKIEQGIPEDDPRNAATIADNVGDNVGDCAGMAADLFESYEVTLVAALILGAAAFADSEIGAIAGVMFPLFVRAVGVVTSMVGIMAVTPRSEEEHGMKAINRGFFLSAVISAVAVMAISVTYMESWRPGIAVAIGLVLASIIQILTQYFTDTKYKPVREVADSTVTGPATTVLSGFSVGLESAVWAALVVAGTIMAAFLLADPDSSNLFAERLYFIALSGMGMLTTVGVVVSMDTYGPISDNAQGIAEMSGRVRGPAGRDPRRARRRRQLDEGDHEGPGDRDGRHRGDVAVRVLRGSPEGRRLHVRGHPDRPARRARRAARRRHDRVPVQLARDPRRRARRRAGRRRGAQPVPQQPRHHGLLGEARLRARRRHLHEDVAARAPHAGPAGRALAGDRRLPAEGGGARAGSWPARSSPAS